MARNKRRIPNQPILTRLSDSRGTTRKIGICGWTSAMSSSPHLPIGRAKRRPRLLVNRPPELNPIMDQHVGVESDFLTVALSATDPDGDVLSYAAKAFVRNPLR